jgi:glucitol/sorbitol PTS system EIIC component
VNAAVVSVLAGDAPAPADPGGINGTLARWAENFIGVFQEGANTFTGLVVGIVPLLIVLLTAVNALIRMIGPERIDKVGEIAARPGLRYYPIRYLVLPVLAVFFLTNPMAYTMGRFLPENKKPAFYDSAVSFVHPPLGIFPHINPGEYFVYGGIAAGITTLQLPLGDLAVRYFYVGLLVIFIRGVLTEIITNIMIGRRAAGADGTDDPDTPDDHVDSAHHRATDDPSEVTA